MLFYGPQDYEPVDLNYLSSTSKDFEKISVVSPSNGGGYHIGCGKRCPSPKDVDSIDNYIL